MRNGRKAQEETASTPLTSNIESEPVTLRPVLLSCFVEESSFLFAHRRDVTTVQGQRLQLPVLAEDVDRLLVFIDGTWTLAA